MDIYAQETVETWLVADGRTLVAPEYALGIGEDPKVRDPYRWPDILAVRPKDSQILLCEVTWGKGWKKFRDKIADYREHSDRIHAGLRHWLGVGGKGWFIEIWYFIPRDNVPAFRSNVIENETVANDARMAVKVVPLEQTVPWKYLWGWREEYVPK